MAATQQASNGEAEPKIFTPHAHQIQVLMCKARFIACICGAQGGKTTIGAVWFLREIQESYQRGERHDWLISAPTAKILAQSTLPKFNEFFPKDWGEYKEQKQCYELVWGNRIYVRSGDEPDHIEGMTVKGAWFDEPGQMHGQMWINIQARLAVLKGRLMMTSTPYDMNWFWRDVEMKAGSVNGVPVTGEGIEQDIALFKWKSKDSPYFPIEEYDRAKRTMSPEMFKRRYDGEFTRLEGLVYRDFVEKTHIIPAFPIPGDWKRFGGLDFGSDHPTAALCIAQKPEIPGNKETGQAYEPSKFYVYREYYKSHALLSELAVFLQSEPLVSVLADPRGATERDELTRFYGVKKVQTADNSVDMGIERIKMLLRENRLFFFEARCPNTLDEIRSYHYAIYNPDKGSKDEPVKVRDDAMDALRYAFSRPLDGLYQGKFMKKQNVRAVAHARQHGYFGEAQRADPHTGYF